MQAGEHLLPSNEAGPHAEPLHRVPPLETDLYCLYCGYNLRGLSDNPIRCPECGNDNDRHEISVPAEYIRPVLRRMETAPSTCVGVTLIVWMISFPLFLLREPAGILVFVACIAPWLGSYWWTQRVFRNRFGWRTILRDFHLATLCWIAALVWLVYVLIAFDPILCASCLVAVLLFPLGMSVYRRGQRTIYLLQRQEAVAIARRYLHR